MRKKQGMTLIVKTITRLSTSLIMLFGLYIMTNGRTIPGGGFAGGVIMSSALILLCLAFGREAAMKKVSWNTGIFLAGILALAFLVVELMGFLNDSFLVLGTEINDVLYGIFITLIIFGVFITLVALRIRVRKEKETEIKKEQPENQQAAETK